MSALLIGQTAAWRQEPVEALLDGLCDAICLVDVAEQRVRWLNGAAAQWLGGSAEQYLGRPVGELLPMPEDLLFWASVAAGDSPQIDSHTCVRRDDGTLTAVLRQVRPVQWQGHSACLVLLRDLSEQRRIECELEERVAEMAATLESTADGILVTDLNGRVRNYNQKFAALWRLPPDVQGDEPVQAWMQACVADLPAYLRRLSTLEESELQHATDTFLLKSGAVIERVSLPQINRGLPVGRVCSFRDITERLEARRRIDNLSRTDALTGLSNRQVLMDRLTFALALVRREGTPCAVMRIDLDRFKHINDTLGHTVADQVLLEVAQRLSSGLREVDHVARLGSDDFALILHGADATVAETAARRVLVAMQRPFHTEGLNFTVTCSIGIALSRTEGDEADELLRRAGLALQEVKQGGRAHFRFHTTEVGPGDADKRQRLQMEHAMRQALKQQDFRLHYQPQIDIVNGRVVGVEALIRWTDPVLGEVSPARFIPVAEENGFIISIGTWVLREAVAQAARWYGSGADLTVSVNVSALQFQQADFVDGVVKKLALAGLPGERLELELTESVLIHDAAATLLRLNELASHGIKLAVDDFGTGYSSLGYLKRFPITRLKIDRSFVSGLPGDESDAAIVQAIVQLGQALRLQVVAEGVETEGQRAFLQGIGAQQYQGYLFAPALDVATFDRLLKLGQREGGAAPGGLARVK